MIKQRILGHFNESAELKMQAATQLAQPISQAVALMFAALSNGSRILACGNGGSAALCQHFASELVGRFERERLPLPVMALSADSAILTTLGNDYGFREIYAKQVQAFGQAGDVLLVISTSGNEESVVAAMDAALERDMRVVALTGQGGGTLGLQLTDADVHICVPHDRSPRIQEVHLLIAHCLCDGLDVALFGGDAE
jgi:D-sedoheptulose 7-phosphate isomerase